MASRGYENRLVDEFLFLLINRSTHRLTPYLASQGRHYNQDIFVTLQYSKGMNPCWRSNSDIVAVFQQISEPQSHALWEEYGFPLTW